jgi:hypothetical protein
MATKKQKEELIQTLKFTPVRARIMLSGYGGECYIGSVSREDYEFFKSRQIDIEQYATDWDDGGRFKDVPDQHRFFSPGQPYDCDNLFHQSGATMDDSSYLTVMNDDTREDIFETNLRIGNLEDQGIEVECSEEFDSVDLNDGDVIFWSGQGEKGCFFDGEITLRRPFDPRLLKITYAAGDGWDISSSVTYDGEEVDGFDGYSTTGKWTEHKFWIKGDEEVYAGVERDEDSEEEDDDEKDDWSEELDKIQVPVLEGEETWASRVIDEADLSAWHAGDVAPLRKGVYEVEYEIGSWPWPMTAHIKWTGRKWQYDRSENTEIRRWRGLNYDPTE